MFAANDGIDGVELWRSNGQVAGTVRVKNINPGLANSNPANFFNHNGTLFFSAENVADGRELWKSNAFGSTTLLAANVAPGAASSNPTAIGGSYTTLFFSANDGTSGNELWTLSNPLAPAPILGLLTQNAPSSGDNGMSAFEVSLLTQYSSSSSCHSRWSRSEFKNVSTVFPLRERANRSNAIDVSRRIDADSDETRGMSRRTAQIINGPPDSRFAYDGAAYYFLDADSLHHDFHSRRVRGRS